MVDFKIVYAMLMSYVLLAYSPVEFSNYELYMYMSELYHLSSTTVLVDV